MNSLKKVAAIAAIVSAAALLLTIILTPFAVSGVIDTYNAFIEKAEENSDSYWMEESLKKGVLELNLADYPHYGDILIEESPDDLIHIRYQDWGFQYLQPSVSYNGQAANVSFIYRNDIKLNEENILQAVAAEISNAYPRMTIIQIPSSVSLKLDEDYMDMLYYTISLGTENFANFEEVQQQLDTWYEQRQVQNQYNEFMDTVVRTMDEIQQLRIELNDASNQYEREDAYMENHANIYLNIQNMRSDLLKRSYNFRKEHSTISQEALDSQYLELTAIIEELCAAEQNYDLCNVKIQQLTNNVENSYISYEAFSEESNKLFTQQVDLDLTISTLRQKFEDYLYQELELYQSSEISIGADGVAEVQPSETVTIAPVETTEVDTPVVNETPVPQDND